MNDGTLDEPDNDPRGAVTAEFDSPNSSFPPKSVNGVHARLPAIGFDETGVQYNAPMVGADDGFHDDAVVRGVSNTLLVAEDPKTYEVPSGSTVSALYWEPKKLTSVESLLVVGD